MKQPFKWQDLANKFRQMVFCLTFLLCFGISIGNAAGGSRIRLPRR